MSEINTDIFWWKKTVIYSAYVDRFAGTFIELTKKLDYLSALGIDCIHLLPFYPSPMIDGGYDISDYCAIRSELGTIEDFSNFTSAAHKKGIRIIIDFVLNHISTEHPWFLESRRSLTNAKRDFFLWSKTGKEYAGAQNPFIALKPNNWIFDPQTGEYYFSTFYPQQADLNWNYPEVFSQMMRVVDFWAQHGVDGFRLDAAGHLIKKEGTGSIGLPETHALLKKIRAHLTAYHPRIILLAEPPGEATIETLKEYFGSGDECNMVYHFPLVAPIFNALRRNNAAALQKLIRDSGDIPANAQWATLLRHHDELPITGLPENERGEFSDFFDSEGKYKFNHGISLRLATMFHGDKKKILDAFRLLFGIPGSPIIYYGDEIGLENEPLPSGEKDTRISVRGKFDWVKAEKEKADPTSLFNGLAKIIDDWK